MRARLTELKSPLVVDRETYERCRRLFEQKYEAYRRLDEELGANTKLFDELQREYEFCGGKKAQREALRKRIRAEWDERSPDIFRKVEQYRLLHVEVKRLKEGVNHFVALQSGVESAGASPSSEGRNVDIQPQCRDS